MDFITGSYCIDSEGKTAIEDLRNIQEDTSYSGPENPQSPKRKELQELIDTPYEGLGIDYLKRVGKELDLQINSSLNLNLISQIASSATWTNPRIIKETVERVRDIIPPKCNPEIKLKDLTDRELWEIAFYFVRNVPDYGKKSSKHFWENSGEELKHPHAKKSLLEKGSVKKLIDAVNIKICSTIFQNGKRVFPIPTIDVTDVIRDNFPSLRMNEFRKREIPSNISEIGVFGGIKEVTITGRFEDLSNYTDFATRFLKDCQPYSFLIELKDWFGVDEDDVMNSEKPAVLQRYQLAAFWLLQHQRGYKPFVNTLQFDRYHSFAQNYQKYIPRNVSNI